MAPSRARWFTAQEAAAILNLTSAEVCTLLAVGRLSGKKMKQPGRAGRAQWLIEPGTVRREKKKRDARLAKRAAAAKA